MENKTQLEIIHSLNRICEESNLLFWLYGGWWIDALLNTITREHNDIDILVNYADKAKFKAILLKHGGKIKEEHEKSFTFTRDNIDSDIRFFTITSNEDFILDLNDKDENVYPFPRICIPTKKLGTLENKRINAVSWEFHYVATEGYRYYKDIPLRDKANDH